MAEKSVNDKNLNSVIQRIKTLINGKAPNEHTHNASDITDLQNTLNGKADSEHGHGISDITNLQDTLNNKADSEHDHDISDITNLQDTLNGKADNEHDHDISDITDLQNTLDDMLNRLLPTVTSEDNGNVLKVVDGTWTHVNDEDTVITASNWCTPGNITISNNYTKMERYGMIRSMSFDMRLGTIPKGETILLKLNKVDKPNSNYISFVGMVSSNSDYHQLQYVPMAIMDSNGAPCVFIYAEDEISYNTCFLSGSVTYFAQS